LAQGYFWVAIFMYNPPHPGGLLKEDVLPELELTVTPDLAKVQLTVRYDADIVEAFKAGGDGWQTRIFGLPFLTTGLEFRNVSAPTLSCGIR